MGQRQRYLLLALVLGFLLLLALVFQNFVLAEIVVPLATVLWLLLRIFVLSIDQHVYWWALIGVAVVIVVSRLLRETGPIAPDRPPEENPVLHQVLHWQGTITNNLYYTGEHSTLKRSLLWLLTSLYAPRGQGFAGFDTERALRERRIAVPEGVYSFLLLREPEIPRVSFFRHPVHYARLRLRAGQLWFQSWLRRVTGREAAAYYRAIDETLTLMEYSLEIKHDDDSRNASVD